MELLKAERWMGTVSEAMMSPPQLGHCATLWTGVGRDIHVADL